MYVDLPLPYDLATVGMSGRIPGQCQLSSTAAALNSMLGTQGAGCALDEWLKQQQEADPEQHSDQEEYELTTSTLAMAVDHVGWLAYDYHDTAPPPGATADAAVVALPAAARKASKGARPSQRAAAAAQPPDANGTPQHRHRAAAGGSSSRSGARYLSPGKGSAAAAMPSVPALTSPPAAAFAGQSASRASPMRRSSSRLRSSVRSSSDNPLAAAAVPARRNGVGAPCPAAAAATMGLGAQGAGGAASPTMAGAGGRSGSAGRQRVNLLDALKHQSSPTPRAVAQRPQTSPGCQAGVKAPSAAAKGPAARIASPLKGQPRGVVPDPCADSPEFISTAAHTAISLAAATEASRLAPDAAAAAAGMATGHPPVGHLQTRIGRVVRHAASGFAGPRLSDAVDRPRTPLAAWLVSSLSFSDSGRDGDGNGGGDQLLDAELSQLPRHASALDSFPGLAASQEGFPAAAGTVPSATAAAPRRRPAPGAWGAPSITAVGNDPEDELVTSAPAVPASQRSSGAAADPATVGLAPLGWAQAGAVPGRRGSSSANSISSNDAAARGQGRSGSSNGRTALSSLAAAAIVADAPANEATSLLPGPGELPNRSGDALDAFLGAGLSTAAPDALVRQLVALVQAQAAQIKDLRDCLAASWAGSALEVVPTHRSSCSTASIVCGTTGAGAAGSGLAGRPPLAGGPRKEAGGAGPAPAAARSSVLKMVTSYSGGANCHDSVQSLRGYREVPGGYGMGRADGTGGFAAPARGRHNPGDDWCAALGSGAAPAPGDILGSGAFVQPAGNLGWASSSGGVMAAAVDAGDPSAVTTCSGGGFGTGRPLAPAPGVVVGRQVLLALGSSSEPSAVWADHEGADATATALYAGEALRISRGVFVSGCGHGDSSGGDGTTSRGCLQDCGVLGTMAGPGLPAPQGCHEPDVPQQRLLPVHEQPRGKGQEQPDEEDLGREQHPEIQFGGEEPDATQLHGHRHCRTDSPLLRPLSEQRSEEQTGAPQEPQERSQCGQQHAWLDRPDGLRGQEDRAQPPPPPQQQQPQILWWESEATLRLEVCSLQQRLARLEAAKQEQEQQQQERERQQERDDEATEPHPEQGDGLDPPAASGAQHELLLMQRQQQQELCELLQAQSARERQLGAEREQQAARLEALARDVAALQQELRRQEEGSREALDQLAKGMEHVSACILSALLPQADAGATSTTVAAAAAAELTQPLQDCTQAAASPPGGDGSGGSAVAPAGGAESRPGSTSASPRVSPRPAAASSKSRSAMGAAGRAASPPPYDVQRQLRSLQQEMRRMRAVMAARVVVAATAGVGGAGVGKALGRSASGARQRDRDGLTPRGAAAARGVSGAADDALTGRASCPPALLLHLPQESRDAEQLQQQVQDQEQLKQQVQQVHKEFLELRNGEALMVEAQEALVDLVYEMRRDLEELRARVPYPMPGMGCTVDGGADVPPGSQTARRASAQDGGRNASWGPPPPPVAAAAAKGCCTDSSASHGDLPPSEALLQEHRGQQHPQEASQQPRQQQPQQEPNPEQRLQHQAQQTQQAQPDQMSEVVAVIQSVNTMLCGSLSQAMSQIQSQGEEIEELKRSVARVAGSQPQR